jgi:hypothetical protein
MNEPKPGLVVGLTDGRRVEVRWTHREDVYWVPREHEVAVLSEKGVVGAHLREATACQVDVLVALGGISVGRSETALSAVHPNDTYSRAVGRRVSLRRAMKAMQGVSGLSKAHRAEVWTAMREKGW